MTIENKDLLKDSDTIQDVQIKTTEENTTRVTSIAQEEERLGQKVKMPSIEELVSRAGIATIQDRKRLSQILPNLGKKSMQRAILAGLDLPTEGLPVKLRTDEEKVAFVLIQKLISSRFILMQNHISQELRKQKEKEECQESITKSQLGGENKDQKVSTSQLSTESDKK